MPLFEYQCESCGGKFEVIQKFTDTSVETCPECSGRVRRLASAPAIQFKGSGWYITDYGRKGKGEGKGEGDGAGSESTASGTGGSDGAKDKPATTDAATAPKSTATSSATATGSSASGGGSSKNKKE